MRNTNRHNRMRRNSGLCREYSGLKRLGLSEQPVRIPFGLPFDQDVYRLADIGLILRFRDLLLQIYDGGQTASLFFFRHIVLQTLVGCRTGSG